MHLAEIKLIAILKYLMLMISFLEFNDVTSGI